MNSRMTGLLWGLLGALVAAAPAWAADATKGVEQIVHSANTTHPKAQVLCSG